ncbi:metallophosphoesterase [Paenibacillus sp. GCM10012306]|uniref:metallophosphoesterase n=1 Tax=Paenibacillus sp. GCM10012306 TaxID=3317342 RepID=UPI0036143531
MKRWAKRGVLALLLLLSLGSAYLYGQNNWIQTTTYTVTSEKIPAEFEGFRIIQLSDLHSKMFGENQSVLSKEVTSLAPDAIITTGDMINGTDRQGEAFLQFVRQIRDVPIYYVSGNHEQIAASKAHNIGLSWYQNYLDELRSLGVNIVDDADVEIKRGDSSIQLAGLILPMRLYKRYDTATYVGEKPYGADRIEESVGPVSKSLFQILITHNPMYADVYADWGADLVLTGHVHGGIIRIPFVGGLLSPERDFFPKYDAGMFKIGDDNQTQMLVNRGLGSAEFSWRVNNRPEISVVKLRTE